MYATHIQKIACPYFLTIYKEKYICTHLNKLSVSTKNLIFNKGTFFLEISWEPATILNDSHKHMSNGFQAEEQLYQSIMKPFG